MSRETSEVSERKSDTASLNGDSNVSLNTSPSSSETKISSSSSIAEAAAAAAANTTARQEPQNMRSNISRDEFAGDAAAALQASAADNDDDDGDHDPVLTTTTGSARSPAANDGITRKEAGLSKDVQSVVVEQQQSLAAEERRKRLEDDSTNDAQDDTETIQGQIKDDPGRLRPTTVRSRPPTNNKSRYMHVQDARSVPKKLPTGRSVDNIRLNRTLQQKAGNDDSEDEPYGEQKHKRKKKGKKEKKKHKAGYTDNNNLLHFLHQVSTTN